MGIPSLRTLGGALAKQQLRFYSSPTDIQALTFNIAAIIMPSKISSLIRTSSFAATTDLASREDMFENLRIFVYALSNKLLDANSSLVEGILSFFGHHQNLELLDYFLHLNVLPWKAASEHLVWTAVRLSNLPFLKLVIKHGLDPDTESGILDRKSLLSFAIICDNLKAVEELLQAGANPEGGLFERCYRWRPLSYAVRHHRSQIVDCLLSAGADVNAITNRDTTEDEDGLLAIALPHSPVSLVEKLVTAGVWLGARNGFGEIALASVFRHTSACAPFDGRSCKFVYERDAIPLIQVLLGAGFDINTDFRDYDRAYNGDSLFQVQCFSDPSTLLDLAIRNGNLEVVRFLLSHHACLTGESLIFALESKCSSMCDLVYADGVAIDALLLDGSNPLSKAIKHQRLDWATRLLRAGAPVNPDHQCDAFELPPLAMAAKIGDIALVQALLQRGAETDHDCRRCQNVHRPSPLAIAARYGNLSIAKALISAGSEVAKDGQALFNSVFYSKDLALVRCLLRNGAPPNSMAAAFQEDELMSIDDIDWEVTWRMTPLQAAAMVGCLSIVQCLVDAGGDMGQPRAKHKGITALSAAIRYRHPQIVDFLISSGVDINNPSAKLWGDTALACAACNNDKGLVERLLALGADTNDISALNVAVREQADYRLIHRLVMAMMITNTRFKAGFCSRALKTALSQKRWPVIELLLGCGADVHYPSLGQFGAIILKDLYSPARRLFGDREVVTALGVAIASDCADNPYLTKSILQAGADPNSIVDHALRLTALDFAAQQNPCLVPLLLNSGADIQVSSGDYSGSALSEAVKRKDLTFLKLLLDAGADVNACRDRPALHNCASDGLVGIAEILIAHGADINMLYGWEKTNSVIEVAAGNGRLHMVKLFLDHGANLEGERFVRAVNGAKNNGHLAVVQLLEEFQSSQRTAEEIPSDDVGEETEDSTFKYVNLD